MGPSLSAAVSGARSSWAASFAPHLAGQMLGRLVAGLVAAAIGAVLHMIVPLQGLAAGAFLTIGVCVIGELTGRRIWRPTTGKHVSSGFRRTKYYRTTAFLWGAELGVGWSTIQPTSAFFTMTLGAVAVRPGVAILAGVAFGAARGLTLLRTVGATDRAEVERRFGAVVHHPRVSSTGSATSGLLSLAAVTTLL